MSILHKFMFGYLPDFFIKNDSYPTTQGGLYERFLKVFEDEFLNIHTTTTSLLDLRNAMLTPSDTLKYLSDSMLQPVSVSNSESISRKLLSVIWVLNKLKGTQEGLEKYLFVLGITVSITKTPLYGYRYDLAYQYDTQYSGEDMGYDYTCNTCTHRLDIQIVENLHGVTPEQLDDILQHILPINLTYFVSETSLGSTVTDNNGIFPTDNSGNFLNL